MSSASNLPYNPTRLLQSSPFLYIFDSPDGNDQQPRLQTLDLRQPIDSNKLALASLANSLHLWNGSDSRPYIPLLRSDGNITALVGSCNATEIAVGLWNFQRIVGDNAGNGSWTQGTLNGADTQSIGYLAEGLSFSQQSNSSVSTTLVFGGMCPQTGATAQTWTSAASYSSTMLQISRSDSSPASISALSLSGGPIAEAGFSVTPLPPTVLAGTSSTAQSLQQNYVLIGGHTTSAFLNMSQVAIFSMPAESWTFKPVQQLQSGSSDLMLRDSTSQVTPRSGHTALLTEDGSKIIVFGGWVGDVNTPASPQLAVLNVGSGYGGAGSWEWSAPSLSGTGLGSNAGIYGHGAALLPGGIMLIHGGYTTSSSSSRLLRRTATNAQSFLFNTSSNTWITSYQVSAANLPGGTVQPGAQSNSMGQTIGLAVGLTIGFLILIALLIFYFWYSKRTKRRESQRGRELESRSSDGSAAVVSQPFLEEKHSIDGRGGDMMALNHYWMNAGRPNMQPAEHNSATTGLFVDIPSPTRGLRKGSVARNYQYHAAPRYEDKRVSRGSGSIHPIVELDDEDIDHKEEAMAEAQRQLKEVERILQGNRKTSATLPNPLRSHPVSPETDHESKSLEPSPTATRGNPPKWRLDSYSHIDGSGRLSPTKTDDRTSSTLSEASQRSMVSNSSITRTMSTRTGRALAAAAAAHVRAKTVEEEASSSSDARTNTMSSDGRRTGYGVTRSSTNASSVVSTARSGAAESYRTARSAPDDDALLNLPHVDYDDPYRRALAAGGQTGPGMAPTRRRPGILGSLRRAMGAIAAGDRTLSLTSSRGGADMSGPSTSSSPIKERKNPVDGLPRRTVSDGGALLRQKRGKHDWAESQWPPYMDDPDPGDWGQPYRTSIERQQAEEDWDVENAVTKRDVQVMFTVPKSRLRVVNADDRASLRSVSDGVLSRTGSVRVEDGMVTRTGSIRVLASKESKSLLDVLSENDHKD